jgi:hypothetical protein
VKVLAVAGFVALLLLTCAEGSVGFPDRTPSCTGDGVALVPVAFERVKVVVAQGGNTKTGTVYVV